MSRVLNRLRGDLDLLPSPIPDRPGLLMRDPFRYSDAVMVVPPLLVRCLPHFDGAHTERDLHELVAKLSGRLDLGDVADEMVRSLSEAGFLDDQVFDQLRTRCHEQFAGSDVRSAAFAAGGYPGDSAALSQAVSGWLGPTSSPGERFARSDVDADMVAIAAPHASPGGGVAAYAAAYRQLGSAPGQGRDDGDDGDGRDGRGHGDDRTFVILGTSHYGQPNRFGLTRKSFRTPFGDAVTDTTLVEELTRTGGPAIDLEDYCHAVEHSIEFQVVFLQGVYGPSVRILPILCGPFFAGPAVPGFRTPPEHDPGVARMLDALRELSTAHGRKLFWVLGVDMAHVGRRYGDPLDALAHQGVMNDVAERDRARLDRIVAGDADGFWDLVHETGDDDLKWCGTSPLYTFLRANPAARGRVLHYDQWNIDPASVVSFAALAFTQPS